MPFSTRVHLGRLLAAGEPLDGSAAFLWVLGAPETRLRTPGQRCFPELKELWKARFAERNPGGLKIRVPQRKLKLSYRAASGTFEADIPGSFQALPDVTAITAPLQGLRDLLETCMTELEPYSRLLGRRPEAKDTVEGAMLLPPAIRETAGRTAIEAARSRLAALIGPVGMAVTSMAQLAEALGTQTSTTSSQAQATQLALMLDRLDVGMEPDRRYGTLSGGVDASVVVFRASAGAPIAPGRDAYEAARLAAEVGLIAATADGELSAVEIEALVTEARANASLEAHERLRIEAFIRNVQVTPPRLQSALKRAAQLSAAQRLALAEAAVTAVMADGRADASEVRFLERLHKALQLPVEAVHAALHQRASGMPSRLVAVTAEERVPGVPLPEQDQENRRNPSRRPPTGLPLDQARLARIRAETSAVSRLLSGVFSETETPPGSSDPAPAVTEGTASAAAPLAGGGLSPYEGLDSAHGLVLSAVVREGPMLLDRFEVECRKVGLLPGAAMEAVNDWGFECHGELVLEENDELVSVPEHLLPSLAPN